MSVAGLKYYLSNPANMFDFFASRNMLNWMSDEAFLKRKFRLKMGYELDLDNPRTFNEKLQWLKLYDRKPLYTKLVDKYEVRKYIAEKIGEQYLIPLVGGPWNSPDEIDFDALPDQFVLKCTHDSGSVIVCRDKSGFDIENAKNSLRKHLKRNYSFLCREWPYKGVAPRIIAEKYMEDRSSENLNVYKIFCFNGKPKIFQTIQNDKTPQETIDYFDTEWRLLNLRQNFPNSLIPLKKPVVLEKMLELAAKLSSEFAFIRTDMYEINGEVYFSEFTFYSDAGFAKFEPEDWDGKLGSWIELPGKVTLYE